MTKKIVLFDQDGVLADFERSLLDIWKNRYPGRFFVPLDKRKTFYALEEYPEEYQSDLEKIYHEKGFILGLQMIPGAKEGIEKIAKMAEVFICTSPLSEYKNCIPEKYEWVEKNLGKDFVRRMIVTKDKTLVYGDYLVDDKPQITGKRTPDWEHLVFRQPYNNGEFNWHNMDKLLEALK